MNVYFKNLNSVGKKNSLYKSSPELELMGLIDLNSSLPLINNQEDYTSYFTPKISFKMNPGDMKNYSETSRKISVTNIFDHNRLGLSDSFESGRSFTLGIDYRKEDNINLDKNLELKLGTVIRDKEENFIPKTSTINKKNSNLFGSVSNNLSEYVDVKYNFALDNNYSKFEYNDFNATLSVNNFVTEFGFLEEKGDIGNSSIVESKTYFDLNENNLFSFKTRRNRKLNLTEYYDLVYEYKNDCLIAGIRYKKSFYEDRDIKPSENLFFSVTLFPLTTYEHLHKINN